MIEACIGHFLVTLPCGLGAVYSTRFEIIHVTYPQRRQTMQEFREKPYLAILYGVRIKIISNGSKAYFIYIIYNRKRSSKQVAVTEMINVL